MKLPADVARCAGVQDESVWREGCDDCLRRTDKSDHPYTAHMIPPKLVVFECEYRIDPNE